MMDWQRFSNPAARTAPPGPASGFGKEKTAADIRARIEWERWAAAEQRRQGSGGYEALAQGHDLARVAYEDLLRKRFKNPARHQNAVWGLGQLPPNVLIQYPSGRWGFVGSVDTRLGYVTKDGGTPTEKQMSDAASFGPRLAGVETRVWPYKEEAMAAARALGYEELEPGSAERTGMWPGGRRPAAPSQRQRRRRKA